MATERFQIYDHLQAISHEVWYNTGASEGNMLAYFKTCGIDLYFTIYEDCFLNLLITATLLDSFYLIVNILLFCKLEIFHFP